MEHLNMRLLQIASRLNQHKYRWLGLFIGWRLLLLALMVISQATVLQKGQWTQYLYFGYVAQLTDEGYFPLVNHWIEYPPVFPWLSALLYRLSSLIAVDHGKLVIFYGLLAFVFVAAEIGVLVFVYRLSRKIHSSNQAMVAALIFGITGLPTYIIYGWFDSIAAFFLFWGLHSLISSKWRQSAVAAALGGLTKLFPLLLVAVAFRILPTIKQKTGYVALAIALTVLPYAAFATIGQDAVLASLRWLPNKSTYETIWALIDGYTSFGVAPAATDFIDMDAANRIYHSGRIPWTFVTIVFGAVGLYIYSRPMRRQTLEAAVILSGIVMQMMILYLKGFSPQFIIWFLPFVPLILPNAKGLIYSAGLSLLNLLEFPIYFTFLEGQLWIIASIIIIRTLLCVVITFEYWKIYRAPSSTTPDPLSAR